MTQTPENTTRTEARLLTIAYYCSFIILGLATAAEGPSLPTLAKHTFSGLDRISLMFVTGSLGYLLGSLAGGWAYDRIPAHRVMAASLAIMVVASIAYPMAAALWVLLVAAFFMGLGKGSVDVGSNTLLQWVRGEHAGPYLNGLHFAFGLGSFLAPVLLAQVIARTQEIYWVFWILAIVILPVMAWLWWLPSPHVGPHGDAGEADAIPWLPVMLIVLAFVLYVGAEVGFANWIYTYAITLKLADAVTAAYLTSAFWALFTIGRLLGIWVATRARPRWILALDFAGCLVSTGLIAAADRSAALLWIGSMALGFSMASIFPTILILAGERLRVRGLVTGWFLLGGGLGGMLLPWLIGNAFTRVGPHAMISIMLFSLLANIVVLVIFEYGLPAVRQPQASS